MFDLSSKFQGRVLKKWRPFQATDFQSLMFPCFIFCHVLGIFPYKIDASTFKISKLHYILSTVAICLVCAYEVNLLYGLRIAKKINFENISWTLSSTFYYILSSFIAIVTYILNGPRMRFLQTIMDISSKLSSETCKKLSKLIHTKDIFSFFCLIVVMMIAYNELEVSFITKLYTLYVSLVVFQMDMLYFNCVYILKACFKRINDNLANLQEPVAKAVPYTIRQIYHEQGNTFLLMELKALKKEHLLISDTVQTLNLVFSLQLLASVIITFCDITFSLYFYASRWPGLTNKSNEQLWFSYFQVFIIYQFLKLSSIVWGCETGKNQALEIGTTIHDVLNSISDKDVKGEVM